MNSINTFWLKKTTTKNCDILSFVKIVLSAPKFGSQITRSSVKILLVVKSLCLYCALLHRAFQYGLNTVQRVFEHKIIIAFLKIGLILKEILL